MPLGPISIIVCARNEADVLGHTARAMKAATDGMDAQIIYVINATSDQSAALLTREFGSNVEIIETPRAGKTNALNIGDGAARYFPRFYVDADVAPSVGIFSDLAQLLADPAIDMAAAPLAVDETSYPFAAGAIVKIWLMGRHVRFDPFQNLVGFSERGRQHWGEWPDVLADDDYARAHIPLTRRSISDRHVTTIELPRTVWAWVGVRARWLRGSRQLRRLGVSVPVATGPVVPLSKLLVTPATCVPALLFVAVRIAAIPVSFIQTILRVDWYRDDTSRNRTDDP